jgi:hypothetical protein
MTCTSGLTRAPSGNYGSLPKRAQRRNKYCFEANTNKTSKKKNMKHGASKSKMMQRNETKMSQAYKRKI